MAKVIAYTTHQKPFRVLVPSTGHVLEFGATPQEHDLGTEEMDAVRERKKQGAPLEIVPLSKRAAEQLDDVAGQVAAAEERARALEAALGTRIADLEAELDSAREMSHVAQQMLRQDLAEIQEHARALEQTERELRTEISSARARVAELEAGAAELASAREAGAAELEKMRQELADAKVKVTRLETQTKRR